MQQNNLIERTQKFAIRIIKMVESLPKTKSGNVIANQVLRSATSVGANYRASQRSKSAKDFINKLKIVEEEADETIYWLELIEKTNMIKPEKLLPLQSEANELLSIFVASLITARKNQKE